MGSSQSCALATGVHIHAEGVSFAHKPAHRPIHVAHNPAPARAHVRSQGALLPRG